MVVIAVGFGPEINNSILKKLVGTKGRYFLMKTASDLEKDIKPLLESFCGA